MFNQWYIELVLSIVFWCVWSYSYEVMAVVSIRMGSSNRCMHCSGNAKFPLQCLRLGWINIASPDKGEPVQ